jgi:hypothetical protein
MAKILTLEEFVDQTITRDAVMNEQRMLFKNIFTQIDEIRPVINEAMILVDAGVFDDMVLENFIDMQSDELYENLFKKAKETFNRAVDTAKEKGKQALSATQQMIIKIGGDVSKVIQLIVQNIADACKKAYEATAAAAKSAASGKSQELKERISAMKDKNSLITEIKNSKAMLGAMKAWVLGGFSKEASKAMTSAASQSESFSSNAIELALYKSINESVISGQIDFNDMINEGDGVKIPFVSTIAAKLNKIPPFSLLYKVKNKVKDFVGSALEKFSVWATEVAGAPGPYKFVALSALIGIIVEMEVKGVGKKLLKTAFHAIPFAGTIIVWSAEVAKYLAYIAIIETLIAEVKGDNKEKAE